MIVLSMISNILCQSYFAQPLHPEIVLCLMSNSIKSVQQHSLKLFELRNVKCLVFDFVNNSPVTALVVGNVSSEEFPLVRIHSRCLYGEVLGSLDCDCKAQLDLALRRIAAEGAGVFIYLEQEGRGCGLVNKAKAYVLNEREGLDSMEAYKKLGLEIDNRHYSHAAQVLRYLGIDQLRLLTNNPSKIAEIRQAGFDVKPINLRTIPTSDNIDYLRTKQEKLKHDLGIDKDEFNISMG